MTTLNESWFAVLSHLFPSLAQNQTIGGNILKCMAIVGTMIFSFLGQKLWVFFQFRLGREERSIVDIETGKLSAIKLLYDSDTVILGAIKPIHDVDTIITPVPENPKPNVLTIDTHFSKYIPDRTLEKRSPEDIVKNRRTEKWLLR